MLTFPHYIHRITMGRLLHKYGNHVFTTTTILLATYVMHSNLGFMVNDYPTLRSELENKGRLLSPKAGIHELHPPNRSGVHMYKVVYTVNKV